MTTPIVVPQSPMGLGDVFGTAFSILRRRFGRLAGISLAQQLVTLLLMVPVGIYAASVLVPQLATTSLNTTEWISGSATAMAIGVATQIVSAFVSVYFLGLLVHCSHEAMLNQNPALGDLRVLNRGTVRRLGPVYAVAMFAQYFVIAVGMLPILGLFPELMSGFASGTSSTMSQDLALKFFGAWAMGMATGLVVSVVSGIVVVKTIYINQVGTIERLGMMAAVKRAWSLTKGSFWRTVGYLIVMSLAVGVVQQVIGMVAEVGFVVAAPSFISSDPQSMFSNGTLWLFYGLVYGLMMIAQVVCVPFQMAFITAMYVDQTRRVEQGSVPRPVPGQYGWQTSPMYAQQPPNWPRQPVPGQQPPLVPQQPSDDGAPS